MNWYWYQVNEEKEAVLLRVFGLDPVVFLPEKLGGYYVTGLSDYCFSKKEKYTGREDFILFAEGHECAPVGSEGKERFFQALGEGRICALAGGFITSVILPSCMKKIGALAFYQCSHLECITFGTGISELGGDAFMNCRQLKKIYFLLRPQEPTGLKQILEQLSGEISVYFLSPEENSIKAAVLFPEYSQQYDLIGPAHIFELNIEGEGFRARQCFEDGVFLFSKYDRIFSQAEDTEEESVLCKMAALRLRYPFGLEEEAKIRYRRYLLSHMDIFFERMIKERDLLLFKELGEQGKIGKKELALCLKKAVKAHWTEGVRLLLMWKEEWWKNKEEDMYGFEDF